MSYPPDPPADRTGHIATDVDLIRRILDIKPLWKDLYFWYVISVVWISGIALGMVIR